MYIFDGKTEFGNYGVICGLIILLILLLLNYNKCNAIVSKYIEPYNSEPFDVVNKYKLPENVRIHIDKGNILVNFTIQNTNSLNLPKHFIVVLAQYNINKKNIGNNQFYLSNEYELNADINIDATNFQTHICNIKHGYPECEYQFNNVDISDKQGNLYYYKIGVSAIYEHYNTPFIMPYNISSSDKMFTINLSIEQQKSQYDDFIKYQESIHNTKKATINKYDTTISTADGRYELIKSQLGNYPDNLLLDEQTINNKELVDLVDKNMANGILNLNVVINETT